jgi:ribonuclease III
MSTLSIMLGHAFANPALLNEALTHPSAGTPHYQRLEFLGDRVLGLIIATELLTRYPQADEGELARRLTAAVNTRTLTTVAEHWQVAKHVQLGNGEALTPNVAADVVEAILGALWLDAGFAAVQAVVLQHWGVVLAAADEPDAKTLLQEMLQQAKLPLPEYTVLSTQGPDHAKHFTVQVSTAWGQAQGTGPSKAVASQLAATALLQHHAAQQKSL